MTDVYTYEHGGFAVYSNPTALDFSVNVNPLGMPEGVAEAIASAIPQSVHYPDPFCSTLREKLSAYEDVPMEHIICGNGASDIIFRLAYAVKPKRALVLAPTFLDYSRALNAVDCEIHHHILHEDNGFNVGTDIIEVIANGSFDMVFLCNPNNPTGCVIAPQLIEAIVSLDRCLVVVDECFADFVQRDITVKPLISKHKNLVILKAFTKIFALAGVRLGYAITGNTELLNQLYAHGADWSVSNLAQAAGVAALADPLPYIARTNSYIQAEKAKLLAVFEQIGITTFSGGNNANYIFFKAKETLARYLYDEHNICIRSCDNYVGLGKGFYRVGIQRSADNDILIEAITQ